MNKIQGRVTEQCFYILERLYFVLERLKNIEDVSSSNIVLGLMITVLSNLINTNRLTHGSTYELELKIDNPNYFDFISQFIRDSDNGQGGDQLKISNSALDSLFTYFNFLSNKIVKMRKINDISPENVFNYLMAINNFEDAMVLVKCFPKLSKNMLFSLISEVYDIHFAYQGKLIRRRQWV